MKKLAIHFVAVILIFMPLALAVGCQRQLATAPTPAPPLKPAIESKTYMNSKYGLSVEYPAKDWEVREGFAGSVVMFVGPQVGEKNFRISVGVVANKLPESPQVTLEDYGNASEQLIESLFENYQKVNEYSTTIDGQPATVQVFTGNYIYSMNAIKSARAFLVKGNTAYEINYTSLPEFYNEYIDCFELAVSSFKFE
jgi:hypothetical protein